MCKLFPGGNGPPLKQEHIQGKNQSCGPNGRHVALNGTSSLRLDADALDTDAADVGLLQEDRNGGKEGAIMM